MLKQRKTKTGGATTPSARYQGRVYAWGMVQEGEK